MTDLITRLESASPTDMNQIEKVARALCEHAIIKAYTRQDRVEELAPFRAVEVDHLWRNHIPEAKAALRAQDKDTNA